MMPRTVAQAFADATSALTQKHDVTDVLARLVRNCAQLLSAEAIGVLVVSAHSDLELLSSTSHRVAELEMFQIQHDSGPCVEAIHTSTLVSTAGDDEIQARWPEVGLAIIDAGYHAVHAYPLRWHGHTLGAMNVFHTEPAPTTPDGALLGQAFADIATIVIVQSTDMTMQQITGHVQHALQARTAIERAKGVLSYRHDLDMAAAYELLLSMVAPDSSLSATAEEVIVQAQHPTDI